MKEEIKQNDRVLLSSDDGVSVPMIFNNLSGRNLSGGEYRNYLATVSREFGVSAGRIELYRDDTAVETATIPEFNL